MSKSDVKTGTKKKFAIAYRPGIRMILSAICFAGILGAAGFSVYQSMRTLYDSNLRDAWTILFMDMETQSQRISEKMPRVFERITRRAPAAVFVQSEGSALTWQSGRFEDVKTIEILGIEATAFERGNEIPFLMTEMNGDLFGITRTQSGAQNLINVYGIKASDIAGLFKLNTSQTTVYLSNRAGRLIFTNSDTVTPANLMKRPLVAAFVKTPFRQGQSEFKMGADSLYGFHQEISRTNLVMFSEKAKSRAMFSVYATINKVGRISLAALIFTLVILQIPLWFATKPIKDLTEVATRVSKGDFNVVIPQRGFGELAVLTRTFATMTENLVRRDTQIAALNLDKIEKTKIDESLKVARNIQDRFLFKPSTGPGHAMDVASIYEPSLQLAGDWYGVHMDLEREEHIISIVDITGHGVESAMLTPVISVIFQQHIMRIAESAMDIEAFLRQCNKALYGFGAGKSTATGIIAKYHKKESRLVWYNAGHPQPVMVGPTGALVKAKAATGNANILGFAPELDLTQQTIDLETGSAISFFSDGLISATSATGKGFGRKHLFESLKTSSRKDSKKTLESVIATWRKKNTEVVVEDDMCLVIGVIK